MAPPDLTKVVMNLPGGSNVHNSCLQLEVDGSLWWGGGMGGNLIVRNPMGFAVDDWEVSFLTPHDQFQSWAGNATVEDAGNGLNRVTFTPADWNDSIPANGEISISFNAQGEGMPNSGSLTRSNFFAPAQASMTMEMGMDMGMDMDMSAMTPDVITGQVMDAVNPLASQSLELIGNGSGYAIARGDETIALVRRSGKALSDATSDRWDFLAAKDAFGGGFRVLAEGEGDRDGQFRVFRFSEEGELFGRGRWISEEKAISCGLEACYGVDLNNDGELSDFSGFPMPGMVIADQGMTV